MYYIKRLEHIEKQLINHLSVSRIKDIRKKVQEYIDEKEIEINNPFEKDKVMILSYLRLLRKRNIYLNDRHCKRYKLFTQKSGLFFDDIFWCEAINISNNQTDFLYLLGLWKNQVIQLENLWSESINQLLLDLYRKILEMLNNKCEVHYFDQLMDNLKDLDIYYEQTLSSLLEEYDSHLLSTIDIQVEQNDEFYLFKDRENDFRYGIDIDFLEELVVEDTISRKGYNRSTTSRELTIKDKRLFLLWDKRISRNKNIKHLLNMIGKCMKVGNAAKSSANMFEELSGLKLGKGIQTVLPSELVQMTIPNLSYLFDLKYIEEKLLSFDVNSTFFQGGNNFSNKQGAMILCLDTSGSMTYADRENIAKAVTYYLSSNAIRQKRQCFIINFSESIKTFNVREEPRKLADFLSRSFDGGTDIEPALDESLRILKNNKYKNADILVISDLQFLDIRNDLKIDIEKQQKRGTKFNVLVVGEEYGLSSNIPFNHIWCIDDKGEIKNGYPTY